MANNNESWMRFSLKDGTSLYMPFSKWAKMTDADFQNLDTGSYTRHIHITEDILDLDYIQSDDEEYFMNGDENIFLTDDDI